MLSLRERYEEAVDVVKRGLDENPGSADVRAYLGMAHHSMGDNVEALRRFEEARRLNPLHPMWYLQISNIQPCCRMHWYSLDCK